MKQKNDSAGNDCAVRRFVGFLVFALIASAIVGLDSLWTGSTAFIIGGGPHSHHTPVSRVVMALIITFYLALAIGILGRFRSAWHAGFAFPASLALICGVVGWPQLTANSSGWDVVITLALLLGMGV
jgi:hypothetical protein